MVDNPDEFQAELVSRLMAVIPRDPITGEFVVDRDRIQVILEEFIVYEFCAPRITFGKATATMTEDGNLSFSIPTEIWMKDI